MCPWAPFKRERKIRKLLNLKFKINQQYKSYSTEDTDFENVMDLFASQKAGKVQCQVKTIKSALFQTNFCSKTENKNAW